MTEQIIFAGFGGQGIMLMGRALSYAAMKEGKQVAWMPSYGAEVRGGTAHSMVVISERRIALPIVKEPSICIVMNSPSFRKFENRIKKEGILIVNKSLIDTKVKRNDIDVLEIPATDLAFKLGNVRVANMVILGALLAKKNILQIESLVDSLKDIIPKAYQNTISVNKEAIRKGYEYGSC